MMVMILVFENAQPVKVEFKFSEHIVGGIYGSALVLTNRLVTVKDMVKLKKLLKL